MGNVLRICALATALLSSSCTSSDDEGTLRIGLVVSTTGPLAPRGVAQLEAAALAATEVNAAGGVGGREIRLVHRDDGGDPARTVRVVDGIVDSIEPVVLGAVDSSLTAVVSETVAGQAVVLSASATDPSVGLSGDVLCTCPSDAGQARLLAQRAIERGLDSIAVIHPRATTFWDEVFRPAFMEAGGTVTVLKSYSEGRASYAALLGTVIDTAPRAIILDANPVDGAVIVSDYVNQYAGSGIFWFFTAQLESEAFVNAAGDRVFTFAHEGIGPSPQRGQAYDGFVTAFFGRHGRLPPLGSYAPNMYDAVYIAALALESAGSEDVDALRAAMVQVSMDGEVVGPRDYASAAAAARAGEDIDYDGASGAVDLASASDEEARYDVWRIEAGQITVVEAGIAAPPP